MSTPAAAAATEPSMGLTSALMWGAILGVLAAAITFAVIYVRNDKNKNTPGYVPIEVGKNVAIVGGIAAAIGITGTLIKHRLARNAFIAATVKGAQSKYQTYWQNPATVSTT
jgi:hypothetical protein